MGWLFRPGFSRKEMIADLTKKWSRTNDNGLTVNTACIAHCYRGGSFSGVLWSVWERTFVKSGDEVQPTERWIVCDLLRYQSGDWGHKGMDESVHPYYYSCPQKYLDMVPIETFGGNAEWREQVHLHHERRREKQRARRIARR